MAGFGGGAAVAAVHVWLVHVCGGHHGHVAGFGGGAAVATVHVWFVHVCGCHHGHVAGFGGGAAVATVHVWFVHVCGGHHCCPSVFSCCYIRVVQYHGKSSGLIALTVIRLKQVRCPTFGTTSLGAKGGLPCTQTLP